MPGKGDPRAAEVREWRPHQRPPCRAMPSERHHAPFTQAWPSSSGIQHCSRTLDRTAQCQHCSSSPRPLRQPHVADPDNCKGPPISREEQERTRSRLAEAKHVLQILRARSGLKHWRVALVLSNEACGSPPTLRPGTVGTISQHTLGRLPHGEMLQAADSLVKNNVGSVISSAVRSSEVNGHDSLHNGGCVEQVL